MKILLTISAIFILALPFTNAWGQVQITGYISAEVVEYTDANFSGESQFQLNVNETSSNVNLGNFNISAKPRLLCNFSLGSGVVNNNNGDEFIIQTLSNQTDGFITINETGNQVLELSANTNSLPYGDQYSGNYHIVFAYN